MSRKRKTNYYEVRQSRRTGYYEVLQIYPKTKTKRSYTRFVAAIAHQNPAQKWGRWYARQHAPSKFRVRNLKGKYNMEAIYR